MSAPAFYMLPGVPIRAATAAEGDLQGFAGG